MPPSLLFFFSNIPAFFEFPGLGRIANCYKVAVESVGIIFQTEKFVDLKLLLIDLLLGHKCRSLFEIIKQKYDHDLYNRLK